MRAKKIVTLSLAMAVLLSSFCVHAADNTTTSAGNVTSTVKTAGGDGGAGDSSSSAFIVAVPAEVTLNRDTNDPAKFKGSYDVGVKGILAKDKFVTVTPAASFKMTGATTSAEATAHVTQEKTKWVDADKTAVADETVIGYEQYAKASGEIYVYIQKADAYSGSLGFTVALN